MHSTHPPHLILFDGVCNVCSGAVQFVIKRDPNERMMFASLQSETGQRILKENGLPLDEFNSFIYIEKGTLYTKVDRHFKSHAAFKRNLQMELFIPCHSAPYP